ncbi:MAG: phosphatase PAP2 family protein [Bacteroidales bacterium]
MIHTLYQIDVQLLKTINGWHTPWADAFMWQVSGTLLWLPLYVYFLYLIIQKFKKRSVYILLVTALLVTSTDQSAYLTKKAVGRPRPSHQQELAADLHYVNDYRGGKFSFPSSHAINTMGVAVFLSLLLSRVQPLMRWLPIVWSLVVGLSRIYLGVHFPSDVLTGFILGAFWGWLWYRLVMKLLDYLEKTKSKAIHG